MALFPVAYYDHAYAHLLYQVSRLIVIARVEEWIASRLLFLVIIYF